MPFCRRGEEEGLERYQQQGKPNRQKGLYLLQRLRP